MLWNQDGTEPQQCHITSGSEVEQPDGPGLNQQAGPRADNPLLMPSTEPLVHSVQLLPTGGTHSTHVLLTDVFFERQNTAARIGIVYTTVIGMFGLSPSFSYVSPCSDHVKLQNFRCPPADVMNAYAPCPWPWPLTDSGPFNCLLPVVPRSSVGASTTTSQSAAASPHLWEGLPIPPGDEVQTSHSFLKPLSWPGKHLFRCPVSHSAPALQVSSTSLTAGSLALIP